MWSSVESAQGDWVRVARELMPVEAHMLCNVLSAAGLTATVLDSNALQADVLLAPAMGGASVAVRASHLTKAKSVMQAYERGDLSLPDDFDVRAD